MIPKNTHRDIIVSGIKVVNWSDETLRLWNGHNGLEARGRIWPGQRWFEEVIVHFQVEVWVGLFTGNTPILCSDHKLQYKICMVTYDVVRCQVSDISAV